MHSFSKAWKHKRARPLPDAWMSGKAGGGDGERGRLALGDRYVVATEFSVDSFSDSVSK